MIKHKELRRGDEKELMEAAKKAASGVSEKVSSNTPEGPSKDVSVSSLQVGDLEKGEPDDN